MRKIRASLQCKSNKYYIVVSFYTLEGKRKQKWHSTGLEWNDSNELSAEKLRIKLLEEYNTKIPETKSDILYIDYYEKWIKKKKNEIRDNTYYTYCLIWKKYIIPYFIKNKIKLSEMNVINISRFYTYLQQKQDVSPNNLRKIHANVSNSLSDACSDSLILQNFANYVKLPKKVKYKSTTYSVEDIKELLKIVKDTNIESAVFLTSIYGFRRSEILGLRWEDIDFDNNTIKIENTLVKVGSQNIFKEGSTKNYESTSILPLIPHIKDYLISLKNKQKGDFICIYKETGEVLKPDYLSKKFTSILEKNKLKKIRFHDLRHSAATLLLEEGVDMSYVKSILRHSNISTTIDTYAAATLKGKFDSLNKLDKLFFE